MQGNSGIQLAAFSVTDAGRVRSHNEDSCLVATISGEKADVRDSISERLDLATTGVVLAVADGLGGENAGEAASRLAVSSLVDAICHELSRHEPKEALADAVRAANDVVLFAGADAETIGMASTLTALLLVGRDAYLASVGDSRAYLLREGQLHQLTHDETLLQQKLDQGAVISEPAEALRYKSVLLRVIGRTPFMKVEVSRLRLRNGDVLLLCTDGLTGEVPDDEIRSILLDTPANEAALRLVKEAVGHGGRDNVTALVARVESGAGDTLRPPPLLS